MLCEPAHSNRKSVNETRPRRRKNSFAKLNDAKIAKIVAYGGRSSPEATGANTGKIVHKEYI